jgi:hypothetical protein
VTKKTRKAFTIETGCLKGCIPESWCCVDCNVNTAPGFLNRAETERAFKSQTLSASGETGVPMTVEEWSEVYTVRDAVWKQAGMEPWAGCLCIGCLEKRLGRQLTPEDFPRGKKDSFNRLPGTDRLLSRRDGSDSAWAYSEEPDAKEGGQ